jgi:BirA family transcriptional regulator, biotin operon repressor / biotin---[acetyl-CoA-carboxylase] ligase
MLLGQILDRRFHVSECCSTNQALWDLLDDAPASGEFLGWYATAGYQREGRGQAGNSWFSSRDTNILLSFNIHPGHIPPVFQFDISRIASLLQFHYFSYLLPDNDVRIKWPNDIYVDDLKLAGMLVESRVMGNQLLASVIGIGINVNETSFPDGIRNPVSLKQLTGQTYNLDILTDQIVTFFRKKCRAIKSYKPDQLQSDYDSHLYCLGQKREFIAGGKRFEGIILGTDRTGLLRVQSGNAIRYFGLKELVYV